MEINYVKDALCNYVLKDKWKIRNFSNVTKFYKIVRFLLSFLIAVT